MNTGNEQKEKIQTIRKWELLKRTYDAFKTHYKGFGEDPNSEKVAERLEKGNTALKAGETETARKELKEALFHLRESTRSLPKMARKLLEAQFKKIEKY